MHYSVPGFLASGIAAGIKKEPARDLALLTSEKPATTVGLFTTNQIQAAPVTLTKDKLQQGKAQALIVNSGNANACTGASGLRDAEQLCQTVSHELTLDEELVMVSSTGIIGVPLPMDTIRLPAIFSSRVAVVHIVLPSYADLLKKKRLARMYRFPTGHSFPRR